MRKKNTLASPDPYERGNCIKGQEVQSCSPAILNQQLSIAEMYNLRNKSISTASKTSQSYFKILALFIVPMWEPLKSIDMCWVKTEVI